MIKQNFFIVFVGVFVACKGTPTEVEIDNKIAQPEKDWRSDITGQWTEARKRAGQNHWVVDVPCEGGVIPFDISEIHKYQKKVDGWDVLKNAENTYFLEKKFTFKNFVESQKFVNEVGRISEEEGHHPEISFGWGYAKINISTHAIEGLSENDFILASKIDKI